MKKLVLFGFGALIAVFTTYSCSKSSTDDLKDDPDNNGNNDKITYTNNVKSIITNNCTGCHGTTPINGAPNSLVTYQQVKSAVENSNLIGRISAQPGTSGAMPPGGNKLSQSQIDVIVKWEAEGFAE